MSEPIFSIHTGDSPLVAAAIHDGSRIRPELNLYLALDAPARLLEEDPHTAVWASIAPTQITGLQSRFEVDLNRPRAKAVYRTPDDAWGLNVWDQSLPEEVVARSLLGYDAFYTELKTVLTRIADKYGSFVVYDLHSYNHRRQGINGPEADPQENPEVNIGTGNMNRERWAPVVEQFMNDLRSYDYEGRKLDVRENVKFRGGYFSQWIYEHFADAACVMAIEFKKFFMNEWTGEVYPGAVEAIRDALTSTIPGVLSARKKVSEQSM
jgi:N-formylglutamate amidohydrolase